MTFIYGEHKKGKSKDDGRPYNFITLSNGFESANLSIPEDFDERIIAQLEKGDEIEITTEPIIRFGKLSQVLKSIK